LKILTQIFRYNELYWIVHLSKAWISSKAAEEDFCKLKHAEDVIDIFNNNNKD